MKGKKIVWFSRHAPTMSQMRELDRLFPDHEFVVEGRPFSGADDIVSRFRKVEGDEMITVAPWTVIRELIRRGIRPIYAEMKSVSYSSGEAEVLIPSKPRRCYKFVRFVRCVDVNLKLEPLAPKENSNGNKMDTGTQGPVQENDGRPQT